MNDQLKVSEVPCIGLFNFWFIESKFEVINKKAMQLLCVNCLICFSDDI
ncbi:conserved hypothetical protein [Trichinella spiralis]|nr:conserved hypothetical protein [Trichinella spiralis]